MTTPALRTRQILVVASGTSIPDKNNKRGHLFETFVAGLLHDYGYEKPRAENLNVTANGIELDVIGSHNLTKQPMIAECKAYSSSVAAKELDAFYGKLNTARLDHPDTFGYFVAVPGLTAAGVESGRKIESKDQRFRVLGVEQILDFLEQKGRTKQIDHLLAQYVEVEPALSDEALVISEHGLYLAVKELDANTRLARRVLVMSHAGAPVPLPLLEELANTTFANGVTCSEPERRSAQSEAVRVAALAGATTSPPTVVEVVGSKSDFEYQYPASPRFFVGRKPYLAQIEDVLQRYAGDPTSSPTVIVLNAQSGWGKSSFGLKLVDKIQKRGGFGLCIDSRTADSPSFVCAALRRALTDAQTDGQLALPAAASFASLQSALETLRQTRFQKPFCIFFDQFENVFRDYNTTLEFRNLTLSISELSAPIIIGFAWKTDLVAFTEGHPYQLRDDIRSRATVLTLDPLSAADVSQILSRLQKESGQKVHRDLRERLREYSQGLPWLLKKLANHILRELRAGVLQEALVAEVLNVQGLFEGDLRSITPEERAALSAIARSAPVLATDAVELARSPKIVQSLLDQRLLVQIGERLDVYWDIFRDFLNRGSVPIEDGYILRLTPNGVGKLLRFLVENGTSAPDEAVDALETSLITIFNMARDLRQLGILSATEGTLKFTDDILAATNVEEAIRARAAVALKRHRAYALLVKLAKGTARIRNASFPTELPKLYPAVVATEKTWATYARAFTYWFQYAGLVALEKEEIVLGAEASRFQSLLAAPPRRSARGVVVFPRGPVAPILGMLEALDRGKDPSPLMKRSTLRRALGDALHLDLVRRENDESVTLTTRGRALAQASGSQRAKEITKVIHEQPAYAIALEMMAADPGVSSVDVGFALAKRLGITWSFGTAETCGKWLRGWMRAAGATATKARRSVRSE